jgi:hypothetical protein
MSCDVYVHDDRVDITIGGPDVLLCLKHRLEIAMHDIERAYVAPVRDLKKELGIRIGGGYWPGRLATGHFTWKGRRGVRQFWRVFRDDVALVIDTRINRPARVVLQHPDREKLAWLINERVG